MKKNISIIGLGWLGEPLARQLKGAGYQVWGSCRTEQKKQSLLAQGLEAEIFELGSRLPAMASPPDLCVLNIPPGRKNLQPQQFVHNMQSLIDEMLGRGCEQILFISTTSVYGQSSGVVTEETPPQPDTDSGQAHVEIERHLLQSCKGRVLRLAGLVGPGRHPVKHLSGKTVDKGGQMVNLIHQFDALQAIGAIVAGRGNLPVLHLAAAAHPSRESFYTYAAASAGLPLPVFLPGDTDKGKKIDASATLRDLRIDLAYADPMTMPVQL
ncbi:SDR family oxidoreductase [Bowmanella dokdonensis]|uniref:SDR family oxidoreductase n=1 Tax=Bowmanella dokdonensis TaxID=751969 RepID=A0A939DNN7_9ALTE|nr:SDR family oxidoreductase [Bowmanella dokdonensis]MBN7825935.1 SDR family oxidoreductase [Bowmanella dokdonensis]